jgi:hypothetical protein
MEDFAIPQFVNVIGREYFPDLSHRFHEFTKRYVRSEYAYKNNGVDEEETGHGGPQVGQGLDPTEFMVFLALLDENHYDDEWE